MEEMLWIKVQLLWWEIILEQEENVLKEILIKEAKEQLTEKIKGKIGKTNWDDCLDAAFELIQEETIPGRPEAAEEVDNQYLPAAWWASCVFVINIWILSSFVGPTLWNKKNVVSRPLAVNEQKTFQMRLGLQNVQAKFKISLQSKC